MVICSRETTVVIYYTLHNAIYEGIITLLCNIRKMQCTLMWLHTKKGQTFCVPYKNE
jgi:hypothetical protein